MERDEEGEGWVGRGMGRERGVARGRREREGGERESVRGERGIKR